MFSADGCSTDSADRQASFAISESSPDFFDGERSAFSIRIAPKLRACNLTVCYPSALRTDHQFLDVRLRCIASIENALPEPLKLLRQSRQFIRAHTLKYPCRH